MDEDKIVKPEIEVSESNTEGAPSRSSSELTAGEETPDPTPAPVPETPPDPLQSPIPVPQSLPTTPSTEQESTSKPEPAPHVKIPDSKFDIHALTDAQLKQAAALYTRRNQSEFSRKGVAKRQETMELNLREVVDFLSNNNGSPLPRIAKHTNITPGTTSKYLRQLIANGKVRADGWGKTRRYYLK